jgi:hypothetical protein
VTIGSLSLLAGKYVISAKVQLGVGDSSTATGSCALSVTDANGTVELDASAVTVPTSSVATMPLAGVTDVPLGGAVTVNCTADVDNVIDATNVKLSAIQVDALTVLP